MKITRSQLQRIVQEELQQIMSEQGVRATRAPLAEGPPGSTSLSHPQRSIGVARHERTPVMTSGEEIRADVMAGREADPGGELDAALAGSDFGADSRVAALRRDVTARDYQRAKKTALSEQESLLNDITEAVLAKLTK